MLTNKNNERPFRKESRNQAFHLSQASFKPMINIALWSIRFRSLITQRAYVDTVLRIFREREMFLKTIIVRKIKEDTPFIIYLRLLNNRFLQFFFKLFREKKNTYVCEMLFKNSWKAAERSFLCLLNVIINGVCISAVALLRNPGTRETKKEQMRIVARAGREIVYLIPAAAVFRIHEEDGRLNRRRGTSAVVDNGGQSHIYLRWVGVHAC